MIVLGTILGIFIIIFGLLYLFSPRFLVRLNELGKKVLFSDEWTIGHRLLMSILFLLVGFFVLWLTFFKR